jgi:hypothetical protein
MYVSGKPIRCTTKNPPRWYKYWVVYYLDDYHWIDLSIAMKFTFSPIVVLSVVLSGLTVVHGAPVDVGLILCSRLKHTNRHTHRRLQTW